MAVIAKIKKNNINEIWITTGEYRGIERVDIRQYYKPDNEPDFKPTRKGVNVPKDRFLEFVDLIKSVSFDDTIGTTKTLDLEEGTQIRAGNREFRNNKFKELRTFVFDDNKDDWIPTPKGVTFNEEIARELYESIEIAKDLMEN